MLNSPTETTSGIPAAAICAASAFAKPERVASRTSQQRITAPSPAIRVQNRIDNHGRTASKHPASSKYLSLRVRTKVLNATTAAAQHAAPGTSAYICEQ